MKKTLFVLSFILAFCNCQLFAQKTWIGSVTDFSNSANRNPSDVLTATDNVTIATITSNLINTYSV